MKNPFEMEKKIWSLWKKRSLLDSSSFKPKKPSLRDVRSKKILLEKEVICQIQEAPVVLFGDDRLVVQDQEKMVSLLDKNLSKTRSVFITDRWVGNPSTFLPFFRSSKEMLNFLVRQQYEFRGSRFPEGGMKALFLWLKKKKIPIVACGSPFSLSWETQDRRLVSSVLWYRKKNFRPIVWTGSLRLPFLQERLQQKIPSTVLVQLEDPFPRWKRNQSEGWLTLSPHFFCWLNRSPLLRLEMLRVWNDRKGPLLFPEELKDKCLEFIFEISQTVRQKKLPPPKVVLHPFSIDLFQPSSVKELTPSQRVFLWDRISKGESGVIPKARFIWLASLEKAHVAEEAAHYVRLAHSNRRSFSQFQAIVEEAFGFLGSLWIDPQRKEEIVGREKSSWNLIHQMGYDLGNHLARRWVKSKQNQEKIRRLWYVHPSNEIEAFQLWRKMWSLI